MGLKTLKNRGFTLVEVVIVSSLSVLIFAALFAAFQYSLQLINVSRAKLSAVSVANSRMEYFRSLPYDEVGTIMGIVPGTIPQNSTTSLNGIEFAERVLVDWVDDPADGQLTATSVDSNAISSDYKQIKLEYSWLLGGAPGKITMVSNIVPRSIETTLGGGTARINVIDENSQLLPGATVRLINKTIPIDTTRISDASGAVLFSGAPAASDYEVIVSGPIGGNAYSVDKTYFATTSLPNPVKAPFTVIEADISTLTFQIGRASDLLLALKSNVTDNLFIEEFSSLAAVASSTDVVSNGTAVELTNTAGVYMSAGQLYLGPVTPAVLEKWQVLRVASTVPVGASYKLHVLTGAASGPYTLIPDTDLPGNSAGFTVANIDLSVLDPLTYPSLIIGLELETSNTAVTASINEVNLIYRESETALANESFSMRGEKFIGTDAASSPVYKFNVSTSTNSSGEIEFNELEVDAYRLTLSNAYDIAIGCPSYPYLHTAGSDADLEISLVPNEVHSLRLVVLDESGLPIPGAVASLTRPGYNQDRFTGSCGQVFFPGAATAQVDFDLLVTAAGYQTQAVDDISVDGDVVINITLLKL
jgi:type II secretory pathway pseudopilin PulG